MSSFPNSPYVIKGGIVLLDPTTAQVQKIIALQYNPDTLTRSLQVQAVSEGSDRSEALRLKGPPVETFKVEAEIDATDQLEAAGQNRTVVENGIHPQISALEMIVYPKSAQAISNFALSQTGTLEIMPVEAPLTLFVWSSKSREDVQLSTCVVDSFPRQTASTSCSFTQLPKVSASTTSRRGISAIQNLSLIHI